MPMDLIRVIEALGQEELLRVLSYVKNLDFERSVLAAGGDAEGVGQARTSSSCLLPEEHEITMLLHDRINESVATYAAMLRQLHPALYGFPVPGAPGVRSWREQLQVLRYRPGERYLFHFDCDVNTASQAYHRVLTSILYLNEDFIGGETEFIDRLVAPKSGHVLLFPSNWCFPHCGREVVSGEKYVVVTWYHAESAP
jgi:hypothetical protein